MPTISALFRSSSAGTNRLFNAPDAEIVRNWKGWDDMVANAGRNGFPLTAFVTPSIVIQATGSALENLPELTLLKDGDALNIGDYQALLRFYPGSYVWPSVPVRTAEEAFHRWGSPIVRYSPQTSRAGGRTPILSVITWRALKQ